MDALSGARRVLSRLLRAIGSEVGREELGQAIGLGCLGVGFWQGQVSAWRAAALVVPGLVVVWVSLPPRRPFILVRPEAEGPEPPTPRRQSR